MRNIWILLTKELRSIFYSPIAYVVGTVFAIINGGSFWMILNIINTPTGQMSENIVTLFFGGSIFFWILLFMIVSIITMRCISEEKNLGTIELLLTAPVTEFQIVMAKFLSLIVFYIIIWLPTLLYILFIKMHGPIDMNAVLTSYFGVLLLGAAMLSFGLLFSSLTKNQIIAAVLTFACLLLLFSVGFINLFVSSEAVTKVVSYIWLLGHFEDFSKGLIDLKRIVYYCSIIFFNVFLTVQVLTSRR